MVESVPQIKWALAAIIAPESLVGFAFSDWMYARKTEALIRKYGRGTMKSWDRTQVYYANMGGFVFQNFKVLTVESEEYYGEDVWPAVMKIEKEFRKYGLTRLCEAIKRLCVFVWFSFQAAIKRVVLNYGNNRRTRSDGTNEPHPTGTPPEIELHAIQGQEVEPEVGGPVEPSSDARSDQGEERTPNTSHATRGDDEAPTERVNLYLNGTKILLAQLFGIIQEAPEMSTSEIEDKSKNTPVGKIILVLLPLIYLTYIIIDRATNGLLVSQLELSVAAYTVCTLLACACYLSKPQSVGVPTIISTGQFRPLSPLEQQNLALFGGTSFIQTNFYPPFGANNYRRRITEPISNDNIVGWFCPIGGSILHDADFASVISGTIFGALYCLCWNSPFPSTTEKYLWRTASVFVTAGLIPYALVNAYFTKKFSATKTHTDIRQKIGLYTLLGCYIVARLFFIWEMFWSLFYQPEGTFQNKPGL